LQEYDEFVMVIWGGLHVGAKSNIKFDSIYKTLTSVINISVIRFVFSLYKKQNKSKSQHRDLGKILRDHSNELVNVF